VKFEFRILGDVAVLAGGKRLDLGGPRQRSVLALLLLQRDRPIATGLLADRLWPDEQPLTAIKTIQVYVSRIRSALGPDAGRLTSASSGYRLAVADDELDAACFERGLRRARESLASGSPDAALVALDETLSLWSGPALGDLAAEQFARREADRLEELRLQAQEELFELRIGAGSGREVIGELRRLLTEQPGRERLWSLLMLALYADGRQGEALKAYHDARRYLADELGLDPSLELQELERAILTQEAPRPRRTLVAAGKPESAGPRTRRVVTVLRADAVRASDHDLDPEILEALDRQVAEAVGRAVERHGGTIDRTDPAGVTAVFGLAVAREDDAMRAVRAAFELRDVPAPKGASGGVVLRVGLATGEVLADPDGGYGARLTGAPLQVAARLAALATPHEALLASETAGLVGGAASTERVSLAMGIGPSSAVRLIALTDGDAIIPRTTTRFVGRAAELDVLGDAFERTVVDGAPGLVTVIGAPGVGKSRLVAESFARISRRARILRSRCLPYGDGITYWPVRELVLAASGITPVDTRDMALAKLETVVAGSDRRDLVRKGVASIVGLTDETVRSEEIPWAVRRFFEALAAERPLVLLVDDLQWAEPGLVDILEHVLDLGRGSMLLVTVARPELEEIHPEWLSRSSIGMIQLDALGDTDAATLLDHLAPELPPGPLRSRILAAAEGNPLFVEQFVAYASDQAGAHDRGSSDRTAADLPIPPTIGALLAARLDRVPADERRLLEAASVIGRTFWAGALADSLPEAERADLSRRLARLTRRELIRPERSDVPGDEAYRFRHLLIRDAAYARLPKRERAKQHGWFAGWLEARSEAKPGEFDLILGYHLEQAFRYRRELGDDGADTRLVAQRALELIAPAGLAAEERGDPHAAVSLLRRAVDLAPPGRQRIELLISLRDALRTAGEAEASDLADTEVVALLTEHPDEGLSYRRRLTESWFNGDASMAEVQAAYAYYDRVGDGMGMVRALQRSVDLTVGEGRISAGAELLDQATDLAVRIGRPDRAATLTALTAFIFLYGPLPVPDTLVRLRRYLELAGSNGYCRALVLMEIGRFEAMSDVGDGWRSHFDEARVIFEDLGLLIPFRVAGYPRKLGAAEVAAGEPARVVELLEQSCSTLDRLGPLMVGHLATLASTTAEALLAVGRIDEAERYASWGKDIADSADEEWDWRMAMSGVRSVQGRHDEAVSLARGALELFGPDSDEDLVDRGRAHMWLAAALRGAGDEPAALGAAHEARQLATAKQDRAALRKVEAFFMVDG